MRGKVSGRLTSRLICLCLFAGCGGGASSLEVRENAQGWTYIAHRGEAAFGYGASPQGILTYLPSGAGNDYRDWVAWAAQHKMNHVRSYPPSFLVPEPAMNVYQSVPGAPDQVDLSLLNDAYFDGLREAVMLFREKGFFVHLQLWQAVSWKKNWEKSYYNPKNNINPKISRGAGPGEFMTLENPALLAHQKEYVRKILDSVGNLGNVYLDIANEIGNGTASNLDWVLEILATIREWEQAHNKNILVTINDEGGVRVQGVEEAFRRLDLIVKDLGRWDEHIDAQQEFGKPTVSVRNIDWNYHKGERRYFFGEDNLEVNEDELLQIRGRKYWWRMYMARVQMAGAYADAYDRVMATRGATRAKRVLTKLGMESLMPTLMAPSYRLNTLSEQNYLHFRNFVDAITAYHTLIPSSDIVMGHPAAHSYCLQSAEQAIIYLESPNGDAGYEYDRQSVKLRNLLLDDGSYSGYFYHPESGEKKEFTVVVNQGAANLVLPAFSDDLAVVIR